MNLQAELSITSKHDGMPGSGGRRKPWLAAVMSMMLPGFGQLYNAQVNRAIWLFLMFCLFTVPAVVSIALYLPAKLTAPLLMLSTVLAVAVWLFGIVDAAAQSVRLNRDRVSTLPRPWQRSGLYVLVFLICNLLILPAVVTAVRVHLVQAFRIPSASMQPTLQPGDYLFADMRYNCPGCANEVARGDVAIFVYPDNRNRYYVKRIIGLPGDRVTIAGTAVSVDGMQLNGAEPADALVKTEKFGNRQWQVRWDSPLARPVDVVVKPGHVFVLGDNRAATTDSRDFGQVPLIDVVGLARQIWFSVGDDGIRWQRIGRDAGAF